MLVVSRISPKYGTAAFQISLKTVHSTRASPQLQVALAAPEPLDQ